MMNLLSRSKLILSLLFSVATRTPSNTNAQYVEPCETLLPHDYDSGETLSPAQTTVRQEGTPWIQLDLSGTELAPQARLVLSVVSTTDVREDASRDDNELIAEQSVQELDATGLKSSNGFSAMFDGDAVTVELVPDDGGEGGVRQGGPKSRLRVSGVRVGLCEGKSDETICGSRDDRTQSYDDRQGRIGGCTGWLISEDIFVQAGHCGTPSSGTRIHFTYSQSLAPVQKQYAADVSTYKGINSGVGKDWGAGRLLPNASTGKLPGEVQGWYVLGGVPSRTSGNTIRITGYGTADINSRSQKTHVGDLVSIHSEHLRYDPDTTGGNSGSPVVHEQTGLAVGIHTHGGCDSSGGSNQGTRIDRSDLASHIDWLRKTCTQDAQCSSNHGSAYCDDGGRCRFNAVPVPSSTPVPCPISERLESWLHEMEGVFFGFFRGG